MQILTKNQRAFVIALVEMGAKNPTEAAMVAGYGGTDQARKTAAKELMRNPKVLNALKEEADKRLRSGALMAASRLIEIAGNPHDINSFKACVELLNRADLIVSTKHEVTVHDNRTSDEVMNTILSLAKKNNIDPKTLLGYNPADKVVDAEFKEVVPSTDGVEDLLA
jgi:hypothetical protein